MGSTLRFPQSIILNEAKDLIHRAGAVQNLVSLFLGGAGA